MCVGGTSEKKLRGGRGVLAEPDFRLLNLSQPLQGLGRVAASCMTHQSHLLPSTKAHGSESALARFSYVGSSWTLGAGGMSYLACMVGPMHAERL